MSHASAAARTALPPRKQTLRVPLPEAANMPPPAPDLGLIARELGTGAEEFMLTIEGLIDYNEALDEHGDRHLEALAGGSRVALRHLKNYALLFEDLADKLKKVAA